MKQPFSVMNFQTTNKLFCSRLTDEPFSATTCVSASCCTVSSSTDCRNPTPQRDDKQWAFWNIAINWIGVHSTFCALTVQHSTFCAVTVQHSTFCAVTVQHSTFCALTVQHCTFCAVTVQHSTFCALTVQHSTFCALTVQHCAFCAVTVQHSTFCAVTVQHTHTVSAFPSSVCSLSKAPIYLAYHWSTYLSGLPAKCRKVAAPPLRHVSIDKCLRYRKTMKNN